MKNKKIINRRDFLKNAGKISSGLIVGGYLLDSILLQPTSLWASIVSNVFVAKNGTPAENIQKVIDMRFGGIENFIATDDVVVINPNGQWPAQGGTNCASIMGLIDLILNRPGGFDGEIILTECTQHQVNGYWNTTFILRNGPYNFNDMIAYYKNNGHANVNGVRIWRQKDKPSDWPVVTGPDQGQGWVRPEWESPNSGCLFYLAYPIIRSPYSNRLIDLKNGIYDGGYEGQPNLKFIKMPTLNNHGSSANQDYAGITSAVKSFMGITELEGDTSGRYTDGHNQMHTYGSGCHGGLAAQRAFAAGEAAGGWMNTCRKPDICITAAEWVGWGSRYGTDATQAKTVGLCDDPVGLDYFMAKYVLYPLAPQQPYFNPDYNIAGNMTRQNLDGCASMGHGTTNEAEIAAFVYDFNMPQVFRFDIDRKIEAFNRGEATQAEVLELIEQYNATQK